jgi:hypothetical protein
MSNQLALRKTISTPFKAKRNNERSGNRVSSVLGARTASAARPSTLALAADAPFINPGLGHPTAPLVIYQLPSEPYMPYADFDLIQDQHERRLDWIQLIMPYTIIAALAGLCSYAISQITESSGKLILHILTIPEKVTNNVMALFSLTYQVTWLSSFLHSDVDWSLFKNMSYQTMILVFVGCFICLCGLYELTKITELRFLGFAIKKQPQRRHRQRPRTRRLRPSEVPDVN